MQPVVPDPASCQLPITRANSPTLQNAACGPSRGNVSTQYQDSAAQKGAVRRWLLSDSYYIAASQDRRSRRPVDNRPIRPDPRSTKPVGSGTAGVAFGVKFAVTLSVTVPPAPIIEMRLVTVAASPVLSIVPTKWEVKVAG